MLLFRCIAPKWLTEQNPSYIPKEGQFSQAQLKAFNEQGYNIYYYPNYPKQYKGGFTSGDEVDTFEWLYVDMDLKEGNYGSKDEFINTVLETFPFCPTRIVDSGNGVHMYWRVTDLDARGFVRLERRLARCLKTDIAVGKIHQLMRYPGYFNTKDKDNRKLCVELHLGDDMYTMDEFDQALPQLSMEDEIYAKNHFDQTYNLIASVTPISSVLPAKFQRLLRESKEVKEIWQGNMDDRSSADFRLGHLLWSHGFTKEEAISVLMNCQKGLSRAPKHRESYALNIISKIKEYEQVAVASLDDWDENIGDILSASPEVPKGERMECHPCLDNTERGFRLGQVIGLVAGAGVGKTTVALNMFRWLVQKNPDYVHFFVPLEQTANEIAERWATICQGDTTLHRKVHVMSNFAKDGTNRLLSLDEIEDYIIRFQQRTGSKVGCLVIDHIGALKREDKNGTNEGLIALCHKMKSVAIRTNTLMIMQSQAPREKAGDGDLELSKSAAYGTVFFESFVDFLLVIWQPLKSMHHREGCPTVLAYKFCKIRYKKKKDVIKEDVPYYLYFDVESERLREMVQEEEYAFKTWDDLARKHRDRNRKTDAVTYTKISWGDNEAKTKSNTNEQGSGNVTQLPRR